jgi:hypothetical protein
MKSNEIGVKVDYESNDSLPTAVRCLPALALVPPVDVIDAFLPLAESMPEHDVRDSVLF